MPQYSAPTFPGASAPPLRRVLRAVALAPAVLLPLAAGPAVAVPPEAWPDAEPVSALSFLLVLLVIPLGLGLVIAVLAVVPAMVRGQRYTPGLAWRNEAEWFGGPTDGLGAADRSDPQALEGQGHERGGASARW
jgi:hypothetical protein